MAPRGRAGSNPAPGVQILAQLDAASTSLDVEIGDLNSELKIVEGNDDEMNRHPTLLQFLQDYRRADPRHPMDGFKPLNEPRQLIRVPEPAFDEDHVVSAGRV